MTVQTNSSLWLYWVSSEEQANSGLSLLTSGTKITAHAKAMDIQLIEVIEDSGKSEKPKPPRITKGPRRDKE